MSRFSGDTMPSESLAQAGEGASLLIHEATFSNGQEDLAHAKAHSTISQAIDVAKQWAIQLLPPFRLADGWM
jgi:ribonuclease Z